jgi:hypothetical protein
MGPKRSYPVVICARAVKAQVYAGISVLFAGRRGHVNIENNGYLSATDAVLLLSLLTWTWL